MSLSVDGSTIVTGVTPGFGLTGGGSGGDVTLAVDPATVQRRVGSDCDFPGGSISKIAENGSVSCRSHGVVATLSAGTVASEGSHDTDLCVIGSSGGKSENTLISTPVTLPAGTYLPVPTGPPDDGFQWLIRKISAVGSDPDDIHRGRAWAFIKSASDTSVSQFIRAFSSAGHENNLDQDGTFTSAGGQYHLEIFAGADPCTYVLVGGGIDLVRIG